MGLTAEDRFFRDSGLLKAAADEKKSKPKTQSKSPSKGKGGTEPAPLTFDQGFDNHPGEAMATPEQMNALDRWVRGERPAVSEADLGSPTASRGSLGAARRKLQLQNPGMAPDRIDALADELGVIPKGEGTGDGTARINREVAQLAGLAPGQASEAMRAVNLPTDEITAQAPPPNVGQAPIVYDEGITPSDVVRGPLIHGGDMGAGFMGPLADLPSALAAGSLDPATWQGAGDPRMYLRDSHLPTDPVAQPAASPAAPPVFNAPALAGVGRPGTVLPDALVDARDRTAFPTPTGTSQGNPYVQQPPAAPAGAPLQGSVTDRAEGKAPPAVAPNVAAAPPAPPPSAPPAGEGEVAPAPPPAPQPAPQPVGGRGVDMQLRPPGWQRLVDADAGVGDAALGRAALSRLGVTPPAPAAPSEAGIDQAVDRFLGPPPDPRAQSHPAPPASPAPAGPTFDDATLRAFGANPQQLVAEDQAARHQAARRAERSRALSRALSAADKWGRLPGGGSVSSRPDAQAFAGKDESVDSLLRQLEATVRDPAAGKATASGDEYRARAAKGKARATKSEPSWARRMTGRAAKSDTAKFTPDPGGRKVVRTGAKPSPKAPAPSAPAKKVDPMAAALSKIKGSKGAVDLSGIEGLSRRDAYKAMRRGGAWGRDFSGTFDGKKGRWATGGDRKATTGIYAPKAKKDTAVAAKSSPGTVSPRLISRAALPKAAPSKPPPKPDSTGAAELAYFRRTGRMGSTPPKDIVSRMRAGGFGPKGYPLADKAGPSPTAVAKGIRSRSAPTAAAPGASTSSHKSVAGRAGLPTPAKVPGAPKPPPPGAGRMGTPNMVTAKPPKPSGAPAPKVKSTPS